MDGQCASAGFRGQFRHRTVSKYVLSSGRGLLGCALTSTVQAEEIKASKKSGVLTVTFPKMTPEQAPRRIAIS